MAKIGRKRHARRRRAGLNRTAANGKNQVTARVSLATIAQYFPAMSLQRIYLHGAWQRERGRNPTLTLNNVRDPRLAFAYADELEGEYLRSVLRCPGSRSPHVWEEGSAQVRAEAMMAHAPPEEVFAL